MGEPLEDHAFIQALPSDNPHLPSDYIDDMRKAHPGAWVDKYIEGSWDALEGQVWPDYNHNIHAIKPFEIPEGWKKFRAIDHGQQNPTCCLWFAIDPDENVYVYQEYYDSGVISNHCKAINELSHDEEYAGTWMDPSCWGKTMQKYGGLWSVSDEYTEHNIYCTRANNSVLAGINRVGEYFKLDAEKMNPITQEPGSPSLFIFNSCRNLLLELPDYIWATNRITKGATEKPKKKNDHACDALRYGIMTRQAPEVLKQKTPFNSFMETRNRLIKAKKDSARGRGTVQNIYAKSQRRI